MKEEETGLKAGLEIHQQLDTSKLFCRCPSILRNDEPIQTILRKLSPVSGESGEIDLAAKHEKKKGKHYLYNVFDTNCLVETDEEPPHEINKEALKIAIQISLLLNAKIFPVTQVMRKIVIDGSNTSGFQRTVLIAYDGHISTSAGKVRIDTIALEEDSARKINQDKDSITYSLDRLGIPLVEITTKPDLKTPEQIKEAALKIGEILRSCKVKRGIGTIRQDLNISIKGSKRVEIKGFQDPKNMIKIIQEEIKRQKECVEKNESKSEVRRALPNGKTEFLRPMPGSARMYPETDHPLLKISKKEIDEIKKTLPKLVSENKSYLKKFGLNDELVSLVLKEKKLEDFKVLSKTFNDYSLIAKCLTIFQKEISKKEKIPLKKIQETLNAHVIEAILEKIGSKIEKEDVRDVMKKIAKGMPLKKALEKEKIDLSERIASLVKEKPNLSKNAYVGILIKEFKGKISGKEISAQLERHLKQIT